ncbi:MAG: class I SAM-dependent methyltransferase [Pseudomonadota bacterium]
MSPDAERQSLRERLEEAGHDPSRPTMWIWEGVTPYLPPKAIELTLADLSHRSAPASRLAMTYATPPLVPIPWPRLARSARAAFALLGEPILGVMAPDVAESMLLGAGFDLLADTGSIQWAHDLPLARTLGYPFRSERLAVAERPVGG